MKTKILWLSILGLAWARAPNPIDSTSSNYGNEQRQRNSRSIWPFTSSETTTEAPVTFPPLLPENNEWFVQGETALPQGIDLNKYPVWKVHKYNGINLHPVKLQEHNLYPPEDAIIDPTEYSSLSAPSDIPWENYQTGYQDFLASRGQSELQSTPVHGTYSTGYPAAYSSPPTFYPAEKETYHSSLTPGSNPYNIQTQQKYEVFAPPQPLKDFRPSVETPQVPHSHYGLPNTYHAGSLDYHQSHNQPGQRQTLGGGGEEKNSALQPQAFEENKPDLSLLDNIGILGSFLPQTAGTNEGSSKQEESEVPQPGFFENLFSRFRGTTEAPMSDLTVDTNEHQSTNSGGFLSSVFNFGSENTPAPEIEQTGSGYSSSFFNQPQTEKPAVVLPTTYYLPKTRGSYIDIKIPSNPHPGYTSSIGPYEVPNIPYYDSPNTHLTQHEIPSVSGPTSNSNYPYNLGYSDVRNSGSSISTVNSDTQSRWAANSEAYFTQNQNNYQQANFVADNLAPNHGNTLDHPHTEYLHSPNNDQGTGLSSSSMQSMQAMNNYYREQQQQQQQHLQDSQTPETVNKVYTSTVISGPNEQSPDGYTNTLIPANENQSNQNQNSNLNNQNLNDHEYQGQNFDITNFNYRDSSNYQKNVERDRETVNENNPVAVPQVSSDYIPVMSNGFSYDANNQMNYNGFGKENNLQNSGYDNVKDNDDETLTKNLKDSSALSHDLVPPKESEPAQSPIPAVYRISFSSHQNPTTSSESTKSYSFLPVKEATDFYQTPSDQDNGSDDFVRNLSSLTSYGTPTNSHQSDSFVTTSSNVNSSPIYTHTSAMDKVDDGLDGNANKNDALRSSTTLEQLPPVTKKVGDGRVMRKVMKRRNLLDNNNNNNHRRSTTENKQVPIEEADGSSSIITSENYDSIQEVRGNRQFDGTYIIDGYSKVQHRIVTPDNEQVGNPVKPVPEAV